MNSILDDYKKMYGDLELDNLRLKQKNSSFFVNEPPNFFDISLVQSIPAIPYIPLQISSTSIKTTPRKLKTNWIVELLHESGLYLPPFIRPNNKRKIKTLIELAAETIRHKEYKYNQSIIKDVYSIVITDSSEEFLFPIIPAKKQQELLLPLNIIKTPPIPEVEPILETVDGYWALCNSPIMVDNHYLPSRWDMVEIGDVVMITRPIRFSQTILFNRFNNDEDSALWNLCNTGAIGNDAILESGSIGLVTKKYTQIVPNKDPNKLSGSPSLSVALSLVNPVIIEILFGECETVIRMNSNTFIGGNRTWVEGRESLELTTAVYKWYPKESMNTLSFDHEFPAG